MISRKTIGLNAQPAERQVGRDVYKVQRQKHRVLKINTHINGPLLV